MFGVNQSEEIATTLGLVTLTETGEGRFMSTIMQTTLFTQKASGLPVEE